jgi:hypothetical protein
MVRVSPRWVPAESRRLGPVERNATDAYRLTPAQAGVNPAVASSRVLHFPKRRLCVIPCAAVDNFAIALVFAEAAIDLQFARKSRFTLGRKSEGRFLNEMKPFINASQTAYLLAGHPRRS